MGCRGLEPDGRIDTAIELSPHAAPVIAATLDNYAARGNFSPWLGYMTFDADTNVGTCAFVGPPTGNVVEIAYYTFPEHEKQGYAQQAVRALVRIAHNAKPDVVITAHTLPQEGPVLSGPAQQRLHAHGLSRTSRRRPHLGLDLHANLAARPPEAAVSAALNPSSPSRSARYRLTTSPRSTPVGRANTAMRW